MTSDSFAAQQEPAVPDAAAANPSSDDVSALPPASNKILVIGGPRVGKKFILERLIKSPSPLPLLPLSVSTTPTTSLPLSTCLWPIDTRYYSAHLSFHLLNDQSVPAFTPSSLSSLVSSPLLTDLQGLMLVYDASDPSSLSAIQRWSALLPHVSHQDDDSVMLMVGVESQPTKASADVWAQARDWAIDHGLEHVRVGYDDRLEGEDEGGEEGGEEDEEGVARIAGAFQANHWQQMELKDRASAARQRLMAADGEDGEGEHPLSINARLAQEEEQEEAELEAHLQAEAETEAALERARAELRQRQELEGEDGEEREEEVDEEGKTVEEQMREEERMESHMAGFEAMFERMQGIRQEAMRAHGDMGAGDQGKVLSDAERRRRAEDAIMSMLQSMGLDGDDEEEEDA